MAFGWSLLCGVVIFFTALVSATVDPIVIKGSHFFYKTNGSEFFIRGVTYQPSSNSTPIDSLSVSQNCMRDIQYLSALTTNVIRVSYIDSASDHSACMTALQAAGIYVLVDLPGTKPINSTYPEWNFDMYGSWTQTIDAMAGYANVLGFFAGDSVVTNSSNSPAAAFVKAAVRDLKSYIATKGYRAIPVGYETVSRDYDVASQYFTCSNSSQSIDFLGISDFFWCTNNTIIDSLYQNIVNQYSTYTVPVFLADYGCKDAPTIPRHFDEVAHVYGTQLEGILSGGIVDDYFQDDESKGLVSIVSSSIVSPLPDYTSYSSQIAKITPSSTFASNYAVTNTITQSCPTVAFSASPTLPPIVNKKVCACMADSLQCVASPSLNTSTQAALLEGICGTNSQNCPALYGDGSTGMYGAYSMCNLTERLSWAFTSKYQDSLGRCSDDPNAMYQMDRVLTDCQNVLAQAGSDGTGTITSLPTQVTPTFTGGPSASGDPYYFADDSTGLSGGAIAGIVIGVLIGVAAIALGCLWFFCLRKRGGFKRRQNESKREDQQDPTHMDSLYPTYPTSNMRGGSASILSDDSRDMSELPQFDGSYMGQSSTQWSRTELHSIQSDIPAGYGSVSERDAAILEMHTPISRSPTDLEHPSSAIPPSPMSSDKELPAFRTRMEDKSLPSMKLLSPMIKVSPVSG